jgi:hypothetical protein
VSAENKDSTAHDKRVNVFPKVVPGAFPTVHADKIMVAIDRNNGIATLTLLAMHPQPQIGSEGWILSEVNWDIVGEIKVPFLLWTHSQYTIYNKLATGLIFYH